MCKLYSKFNVKVSTQWMNFSTRCVNIKRDRMKKRGEFDKNDMIIDRDLRTES